MRRIGIVDIGSNSMRLSVIETHSDASHHVVDEHKATPRLAGQLRGADGTLSDEGAAELVQHLREFLDLCSAYGVAETLVVGTAALRAAANRDQVLAAVEAATGVRVEVISGEEEAWLDYQAVRHTLAVDTAYLVDIGGGSTEISLIADGRRVRSHSLAFGAVTVAERWRDGVALEQNLRLPQGPEAALGSLDFLLEHPHAEAVGIGGTVRNLARLHQIERGYPLPLTHNYTIPVDDVESMLRRLADTPMPRRRKLAGLARERADVIVPGGAILLAVMRRTRAGRLRVSGRGLRDGLFYARVQGDTGEGPLPIVEASVRNVLARFSTPVAHAEQVTGLATSLFDTAVRHGLLTAGTRDVQYTAAMLHRAGVYVNYYGYHQHTFYLVLSSQIYGLSHREVVVAALAASFKGRSAMRRLAVPVKSLLAETDYVQAARMGVIVRLAEALDRRHEGRVESLSARWGSDALELRLCLAREAGVEIEAARALAPHVQKNFGRELRVTVAD